MIDIQLQKKQSNEPSQLDENVEVNKIKLIYKIQKNNRLKRLSEKTGKNQRI